MQTQHVDMLQTVNRLCAFTGVANCAMLLIVETCTMLYQITISHAGSVKDIVQVNAPNALAAINKVEANFETFTVMVSIGHGEIISVQWSGYEFEARRLNTANGDQ